MLIADMKLSKNIPRSIIMMTVSVLWGVWIGDKHEMHDSLA